MTGPRRPSEARDVDPGWAARGARQRVLRPTPHPASSSKTRPVQCTRVSPSNKRVYFILRNRSAVQASVPKCSLGAACVQGLWERPVCAQACQGTCRGRGPCGGTQRLRLVPSAQGRVLDPVPGLTSRTWREPGAGLGPCVRPAGASAAGSPHDAWSRLQPSRPGGPPGGSHPSWGWAVWDRGQGTRPAGAARCGHVDGSRSVRRAGEESACQGAASGRLRVAPSLYARGRRRHGREPQRTGSAAKGRGFASGLAHRPWSCGHQGPGGSAWGRGRRGGADPTRLRDPGGSGEDGREPGSREEALAEARMQLTGPRELPVDTGRPQLRSGNTDPPAQPPGMRGPRGACAAGDSRARE